jgi:hypothetical protein
MGVRVLDETFWRISRIYQIILLRLVLKCQSIELIPKIKISGPPLFMTFLEVIEVPEHDKALKNLLSVCLCVSVCLSSRLLHF